MFCIATGCLGWPPSEAWAAAVPEILMAWEAKVDFMQKTNPFGAGGGQATDQPVIPDNETVDQKRARIKAQMRKRKDRDQ